MEETVRSKIKDEYGGSGIAEEQEFMNLSFEVNLTPHNADRKLVLKVISVTGKEETFMKQQINLLSKNRVQIFEEVTINSSIQDARDRRDSCNPHTIRKALDALEMTQKIEELIKRKSSQKDKVNDK